MYRKLFATLLLALYLLASALAQPARAQAPRVLADTDHWGINDWSAINPLTTPQDGAGAYARFHEAGLGWTRYTFYWDQIQPDRLSQGSQHPFEWTYVDAEVNGALENGIKVFAELMWAPQWAVQGTPAYVPFHCMDGDPSSPTYAQYVKTNSYCDNRKTDVAAFQEFVRQSVLRYGDRIRYWGFWNEPNYAIFWHGWNGYPGVTDAEAIPQNDRLDAVVDNILIPGAEAARAANPNVIIVGPEPDNPDALEKLLQRDAQYFASTGKPLFDVISFHQYAPSQTATELLRFIDRYKTVIDAHDPLAGRPRRPVWVTESWVSNPYQPGWDTELRTLLEGVDQRSWINKYFLAEAKTSKTQDAAIQSGDHALIDVNNTPLPPFGIVKSYITRYNGCYVDDGLRALPVQLISSNASVESCIRAAANAGYSYAGLQWYGECFAGNTLQYAQVADAECNTPCNSDSTEACGGAWRNSIYRATPIPAVPRLYEGCYTDDWTRALAAQLTSDGTVESCVQAAAAAGYHFAGLQWYGQCYAGNTRAYQQVLDTECSLPCTASPAETCGRDFRNSIWSTGQ
jgi:hypothetical protein